MIKLLYDLKVGYEECYLTVLNEELDVSEMLELDRLGALAWGNKPDEVTEEEFYEQYKSDISKLVELIEENGTLEMEYEDSVLNYTKKFFSSVTEPGTCCGIWEPSNWRLVYDPDTETFSKYLNAATGKEVCDTLKISRQQLHYYVKTGVINKIYDPEDSTKFKYDLGDVFILKNKLTEKYKKYSN